MRLQAGFAGEGTRGRLAGKGTGSQRLRIQTGFVDEEEKIDAQNPSR